MSSTLHHAAMEDQMPDSISATDAANAAAERIKRDPAAAFRASAWIAEQLAQADAHAEAREWALHRAQMLNDDDGVVA